MSKTLQVTLGARSYPIEMAEGLLAEAGTRIGAGRALIVTDENVARLWLPVLQQHLGAEVFVLPAGEATKSFAQLQALLDWCLAQKPDRRTVLVAFGGGVVGDITGFAASILLRGVPFIQIPTTLLAMVDSSVGGKTGINTAQGKNLIGSFYQPQQVLIDPSVLQTLPERELRAGFAEVIKYGCILESGIWNLESGEENSRFQIPDSRFFTWLEVHGMHDLPLAIEASCRAKAAIVGQDEREETGQRALLNFGHTFGHALEAECGYDGTLLHGEAVAIGMVMAAELSVRLGLCPAADAARIKALIAANGLPVSPRDIRREWDADALLRRMRGDKKNSDGKITLILLQGIGKAMISSQASEQDLQLLWRDFL